MNCLRTPSIFTAFTQRTSTFTTLILCALTAITPETAQARPLVLKDADEGVVINFHKTYYLDYVPGTLLGNVYSRYSQGTIYAGVDSYYRFTLGNQYQACSGRIRFWEGSRLTSATFYYEGNVPGYPKCLKHGKVENFVFVRNYY